MSFGTRSMPAFYLFRGDSSYSAMASSTGGQPTTGFRVAPDVQSVRSASIIGEGEIPRICFEPLDTSRVIWCHLVFSLLVTGLGLVYGYYGCFVNDECTGYKLMLVSRAVFWLITYGVHVRVKMSHNRLKMLGYHKFLRWTHRNKKAPIQLVSFNNMIILTMHTIVLEVFGAHFFVDCHISRFPMILAVSTLTIVECILLILNHFSYLVKLNVFNSQRCRPDAMSFGENRRSSMSPEDFVNQQFLMVVKLMDENRHLLDRIREVRSQAEVINSESTHISQVEQSIVGV